MQSFALSVLSCGVAVEICDGAKKFCQSYPSLHPSCL